MDNNLIEDNKIIMYTTDDGQVEIEVQVEDENVWLTQNSMAKLFDTTKQNISLHIKNIFDEHELNESSVVKENLTTAKDGKKYKIKFYNEFHNFFTFCAGNTCGHGHSCPNTHGFPANGYNKGTIRSGFHNAEGGVYATGKQNGDDARQ